MSDELCTLSSDDLTVAVAAMGAEMQYLRTASGKDLLWHGDGTYWTGRAPLLFPIVGRAVGDVVESGGLTAEMKQHGLARRLPFELEEITDDRCQHVLRASQDTWAVYPFDFKLSVIHQVSQATLSVSVEITNEGAVPMPFGFGFHPAFCWPLPGAETPHKVRLANGNNLQQRPLRPDGLLEHELVPGPFENGEVEITDTLFEQGALVFPNGSGALRYGPDEGPYLDFTFENLPDLALWRPVGAPFLCIEPWQGTASLVGDGPEIAKRPNSIALPPDASGAFGYYVTYVA